MKKIDRPPNAFGFFQRRLLLMDSVSDVDNAFQGH